MEENIPQAVAIAIGARDSAPGPTPMAAGSTAKIRAIAVISTGRMRMGAALRIASRLSTPSSRSWLAKSTSRIEFLVTRPKSRMIPIRLNRFSVWPVIQSPPSDPTIASGTASITVSEWNRLSNCAASTM